MVPQPRPSGSSGCERYGGRRSPDPKVTAPGDKCDQSGTVPLTTYAVARVCPKPRGHCPSGTDEPRRTRDKLHTSIDNAWSKTYRLNSRAPGVADQPTNSATPA